MSPILSKSCYSCSNYSESILDTKKLYSADDTICHELPSDFIQCASSYASLDQDAYSHCLHLFGCLCLQTPVSCWHVSSVLHCSTSSQSHLPRSWCTIFLRLFANSSQLLTYLITEGSLHIWRNRRQLGPDISFLTPQVSCGNWTTHLKNLDFKWPYPQLSHPFLPPCHSFMTLCWTNSDQQGRCKISTGQKTIWRSILRLSEKPPLKGNVFRADSRSLKGVKNARTKESGRRQSVEADFATFFSPLFSSHTTHSKVTSEVKRFFFFFS